MLSLSLIIVYLPIISVLTHSPPDNILYGITEDSIAANKQTVSGQPCEYEEIPLTHNQTHEVESQEHTYECSFSDSGRVNENAYAEVGPFDAKVSD